jgi:hypothetical protein
MYFSTHNLPSSGSRSIIGAPSKPTPKATQITAEELPDILQILIEIAGSSRFRGSLSMTSL